ncbi:MAG: hypothetical protein LBO66_07695 [Deltaproteobacteria bacterium]|jgi:hypothetical protein|nr:hypothetical protein [Deltaproteobacteria bacterium]
MKPFLTVIKKGLKSLLEAYDPFATLTGGKVHLNAYDPFEEGKAVIAGLYVLSELPLETDLGRRPDERQLSFQVELVAGDYAPEMPIEERLDVAADIAEGLIIRPGCLPALDFFLASKGRVDKLLEVAWRETSSAYIVQAGRTIGVRILRFELEYEKREPEGVLPDFLVAGTSWRAYLDSLSEPMEASNEVHLGEGEI